MHEAWHSIGQVPYWFVRSSIKFEGHMHRKLDDLNPIWVRLLGQSQLSNPSDLPCFAENFSYQTEPKTFNNFIANKDATYIRDLTVFICVNLVQDSLGSDDICHEREHGFALQCFKIIWWTKTVWLLFVFFISTDLHSPIFFSHS